MRQKKLRDPIHKDIHLSESEIELLDAPEVQRLRGIKQLGAAYLVYPGARHSRFEHCLGTCWMAKRIVHRIESAGAMAFNATEREAVSTAALLHDVTHIPFGHTFEDERRLLQRHDRSEERFLHFFEDSELGRLIDRSAAGRLARSILRPDCEFPAGKVYLRQIISGTICADLLDYLRRDNYFCGLSHGFDDRLFHYFRVADGQLVLDMQQHGLFRRDALSEITNLLRIRYVLSERVYYHHAKIAAGVMISKAIERALAAGLDERKLCELTDEALLYHLEVEYADDADVVELIRAFRQRRLFKRCYMLTRQIGVREVRKLVGKYHFDRGGARARAEEQIAQAIGSRPRQVAIYCAPEEMALKEAEVPVLVGAGRRRKLAELNTEEIEVLKSQQRALWKFYVFVAPELHARCKKAARACADVIGLPNELPAEMRGEGL